MEEGLFRQSPSQCAKAGSLHVGIDTEPASEAFGDDRSHICLSETLKQQVRLLRVYHRIDSHKGVFNLSNAVVNPRLIQFLRRTSVTLVGSVKTLLARPHHHCSDLQ